MANSRFFQFRYSAERDLVDLMFKISIGASGAPTILNGKGLVSIVRNSAGNYTLNLKDNFNVLLDVDAMFISGASAPAAPGVNVVSESVATNKQIILQMRNLAGAPTDPASGEVLMLVASFRNAST